MAHILIVEDDRTLNQSLKTKLEVAGHQVSMSNNGKEGLAVLSKSYVDLILLDILMPEMDGIEMIYHWQQRQAQSIPIIIMTNQHETAYPEVISKVLIKSNVSLKEILDEINQALGQ